MKVGEMDTYDVCCFTAVQDYTELIRVVLLEFDFVLDLEFSNAYLCVRALVFECPRECERQNTDTTLRTIRNDSFPSVAIEGVFVLRLR